MNTDLALAQGRPGSRSPGEWIVANSEIVLALVRRDFSTRFSQNFFGYSWSFVAPLLWIGGTFAFFHFLGRRSPIYTDVITFIVSGIIPYVAFRYTVNAMGRVNGTVRGLLIFPTVTREHSAVAAAVLEYANIYVLAAVLFALNYFIFGNGEMSNFPMWAGGVTLAWLLGAGYGYFFSVLARGDPTIFQFGVIILRPSYFLSGVFFVPSELRGDILAVLQWNPLLHAVEIARDGMLFHYQSKLTDAWYVLAWAAGLFGAGLAVRAWRRG